MEARCLICGEPFEKRFPQELFCSFACADERQRERQRARESERARVRARLADDARERRRPGEPGR